MRAKTLLYSIGVIWQCSKGISRYSQFSVMGNITQPAVSCSSTSWHDSNSPESIWNRMTGASCVCLLLCWWFQSQLQFHIVLILLYYYIVEVKLFLPAVMQLMQIPTRICRNHFKNSIKFTGSNKATTSSDEEVELINMVEQCNTKAPLCGIN